MRVHPVELRLDASVTTGVANSDCGVAVVVRSGWRVVVGRCFHEELLTRVVRVVESWC